MPDTAFELAYLEAGLEMLESYLLSNEIYWTVRTRPSSGLTAFPSLTLARMLLARVKIESIPVSPEMDRLRFVCNQKIDGFRIRWRVAWEAKAQKEATAYLMLWQAFLEEYISRPEEHADRYSYEVTRRVMLELLFREIADPDERAIELLAALDLKVKSSFFSGEFIWEREFSHSFPSDRFWYLFGRLR